MVNIYLHCGDSDNYGEDTESGGEQSPPGVGWWISGEPAEMQTTTTTIVCTYIHYCVYLHLLLCLLTFTILCTYIYYCVYLHLLLCVLTF